MPAWLSEDLWVFPKSHPMLLSWGTGDSQGLADVTLFCHLSLGSSFDLAWLGPSKVISTRTGEKMPSGEPQSKADSFPLTLLFLAARGSFFLALPGSGYTTDNEWLQGPRWKGKCFCVITKSFLWAFVSLIYSTSIYCIRNWQGVATPRLLLIQWGDRKLVFKADAKCSQQGEEAQGGREVTRGALIWGSVVRKDSSDLICKMRLIPTLQGWEILR